MIRCTSLLFLLTCAAVPFARAAEMPDGASHVNSLGMRLVRVEPGTFRMGSPQGGDFDERPVHRVRISRPFYVGECEVTNAQYEQFDPEHGALRGKLGFSKKDDEAVVFVSWHEAVDFCRWLSEKEGLPYRLPTEAEWEYACRAGTTTDFHTGDSLPEAFQKNVTESWLPGSKRGKDQPVDLTVGQTPANAWGLRDVHGNVEEWCSDWYGPYADGDQSDPVGREEGDFRLARGGSHSTSTSAPRSSGVAAAATCLPGYWPTPRNMPNGPPLRCFACATSTASRPTTTASATRPATTTPSARKWWAG